MMTSEEWEELYRHYGMREPDQARNVVALPPECHNVEPVNADKAWSVLVELCRGNG